MQFVTVFSGARDHYQVPLALAEGGLLSTFVTDLYLQKLDKSRLFKRLSKRFGFDLSKRHCDGIDQHQVTVDLISLLYSSVTYLLPRNDWINRKKDAALSVRAFAECIERDATLFAYSYYAYEAFAELDKLAKPRFLFQVHPHPKFLKELFVEEIDLVPSSKESLMQESELSTHFEHYNSLCQEPALATKILVASKFTKHTLQHSGIDESKISVVPYGVDHSNFKCRTSSPVRSGPLRIVFVGSLTQRKGVSYLLDAVRKIGGTAVHLTVFTRSESGSELLRSHAGDNVEVVPNASRADVVRSMQNADLFAIPSLAEGFGLVIAEAMATGLPVLTTPNGGGVDLIEDRVNGFIVPIRNTEAICSVIDWGIGNREAMYEMGQVAARTIRTYTWKNFRNGVRDFCSTP